MTRYFVTGGSGFIGRRVLARLLTHDDAQVTVLVRSASLPKLAAILEKIDGGDRVVTAVGDLIPGDLGGRADVRPSPRPTATTTSFTWLAATTSKLTNRR